MSVAVVFGLCALAGAAVVAWAFQASAHVTSGVLLAAIAAGAVHFARAVRKRERRHLAWDGLRWSLGVTADRSTSQTGQVQVALDLDRWVLLQFCAEGQHFSAWRRPHWLALHQSQLPAQWHSLRCALYSPVPANVERPTLALG